jgi:anaerobic magnesium-protoporphyrin IX monomethyl ester cyclase
MLITLVQAIDRTDLDQSMFPPIGLGYLAAYVRSRGVEAEFAYSETAEDIVGMDPDVVAISAVSQNVDRARDLARSVREQFDGPIIIGGPHISALPYTLPAEFDIGVVGEGEQTFFELIRNISDGRVNWRNSLAEISGICYRDSGTIKVTAPRKYVKPLDNISNPERELFGSDWVNNPSDAQYLFTSRGCPYDCNFCFSSHLWSGTRYFSAEYVVREIDAVVRKYRPTSIHLMDDCFLSNRKRAGQIAKAVRLSGIADEVEFGCLARSNEITDDMCELLREMNIGWVRFGLESGSDRVLLSLINKRVTTEQHDRALSLLSKHDIRSYASFIIGIPGETVDDMRMTAEFIKDHLDVLYAFDVYPLIAYPGTKIWHDAVSRGLLDEYTPSDYYKLSPMSFVPEEYVYLNSAASFDDFLFYYYYLSYLSQRHTARVRLDELTEIRRIELDQDTLIEDMKQELSKASRYARNLEEEIKKKDSYMDELTGLLNEARKDRQNDGNG